MTINRIYELFTVFGKLLMLDNIGDDYAAGAKAHLIATERQWVAASGSADPYRELTTFFSPLVRSSMPVTQALDRVATIAKSAMDNYVRAVGPELGQDQTAAPATILNALMSSMQASAQTVAPSGAFWTWF